MGGQALLETCDVTKHGRHLGFYQELEIRSKPWGLVIFLCLTCKIIMIIIINFIQVSCNF